MMIFMTLLYANLTISKSLTQSFYLKLTKAQKYIFIILFWHFVWPLLCRQNVVDIIYFMPKKQQKNN